MFRHVVLFRFDPSATEEQRQQAAESLEQMKGAIPEIRTLSVGRNAGDNPANFDLVVEVGLDRAEDFPVYGAAPAHVHAWTQVVQPVTTELATIQWVDET